MRLAEKNLSANHFARNFFRVAGLLGRARPFSLRKALLKAGSGNRDWTWKSASSCLVVGSLNAR
jgi:hypothetical protein